MRKSVALTVAIAATLSTAALANITVGQPVGVEDAEITATLEAAGYTVTEIEREEDEIEVEADRDGRSYEIELSTTGEVIGIELDD